MLFSILIANYNNGSFFKDCYNSIINQTNQKFEVIIVDDASTDNSVEIITNLIKNDNRFKLFQNERNYGCGYTKRRCVELATGEICGFVDPDDAIVYDALEKMVASHIQNPNDSLISSKYFLTDLKLNVIDKCKHGEKIPNNESYLKYGKGAVTHFATFKLKLYNNTVGLNPNYKRAVDQNLYYLLEEQGSIGFVDEFLYLYRINKNSISANENVYKARYWHFKALENTYKRRLKNNDISVGNFSKAEMKQKKDDFLLSRMQRETALKFYRKKYYFLLQSIINAPLVNYKYKILCFIKLKYY